MRTGMAQLPLHGGHCPPWLFQKMKTLGASVVEVIVDRYGTQEVLRRLADPVWFQSFGCVLGFDWHSSGLTTVLCGALKEGLRPRQAELGLFIAGGKGRASRRTPEEIQDACSRHALANDLQALERASRLAAKVDNNVVQDGYQLYHHVFVFDREGHWAVVQQGMHTEKKTARRYHWLSDRLDRFVEEPHSGICGYKEKNVLDLTAVGNAQMRKYSLLAGLSHPDETLSIIGRLGEERSLIMGAGHVIPRASHISSILHRIYEQAPSSYEQLVELPGVGGASLRALALVAEVAFGAKPAFYDPVRYSFAHGGKDGHPFPIHQKDYDRTIAVLRDAIARAKLGQRDKLESLERLASIERRFERASRK